MPYIRLIILLILAVTFALLSSGWLSVGLFDVLILAFILAPLALLKQFHTNIKEWNSQSLIFTQYNSLFRWGSFILVAILFYGLYKYALFYGIWKTLAVFLISSVLQAPFYVLLKMRIGMEVLLYPIGLLAIILFFIFSI